MGGVSRNLETVLMEKNKVVGELEDQLREWRQVCQTVFCLVLCAWFVAFSSSLLVLCSGYCQAYFHVIRTYEAKLDEFGIAPTEIGFEPAQI